MSPNTTIYPWFVSFSESRHNISCDSIITKSHKNIWCHIKHTIFIKLLGHQIAGLSWEALLTTINWKCVNAWVPQWILISSSCPGPFLTSIEPHDCNIYKLIYLFFITTSNDGQIYNYTPHLIQTLVIQTKFVKLY